MIHKLLPLRKSLTFEAASLRTNNISQPERHDLLAQIHQVQAKIDLDLIERSKYSNCDPAILAQKGSALLFIIIRVCFPFLTYLPYPPRPQRNKSWLYNDQR